MKIENLPIGRKLAAAFAALIVVFGAVSLILFANLKAAETAAADKGRSMQAMLSAREMMLRLLEQQNAVRAYAILGRGEFLKDYAKNGEAFRQETETFKSHSTSPEQRQRLDQLNDAVAELHQKLDHIVTLAANPATQAEAQQLVGVKQLGTIRDLVKQISAYQQDRVDMRVQTENHAFSSSRWALWIGGAVALAIATFLGWWLSRMIARPVSRMTSVMGELAAGNNSVEIDGAARTDEIGAMAKAVTVFREAAIAKQQADAAKKLADEEQKRVVEALSSGLGSLAEGDLTASIRANFSPEYAVVKSNFNSALESLRGLIGSVLQSTASIHTGSGEIAEASEDLARRTEGNAASLEETAASITQMDQRLRASAAAAARTVDRADGAIATVSGGRGIADEAVRAMERVADSAKGIDSVIEGLDKIAFQTRVLAMNAAVEAGRAGDAGRGFAVVADLVSALAMRAEEEAKRARDQLTVTQTDIVTAVSAVQRVDGALADISGDVGQVHELLGQMASDNQAQSSAITQISVAIGSMDQATQQNAAMVEETSAAARSLSTEVEALSSQAARFKVGGNAAGIRSITSDPVKRLPQAAVAALTRH
jgi:methyl-accepting chemotaxis protein